MTFWLVVSLLLLGVGIGAVSGMVGIGGGLLVIPLLMLAFGFNQQKATGTSLAMLLPPIGIFAVMAYSKAGNIDWRFAGLLAAGFTAGAYLGALLVNRGVIHPTVLRLGLAFFLIYVAGTMLFRSGGGGTRSLIGTALMAIAMAGAWVVMLFLGRRRARKPPGAPTDSSARQSGGGFVDYQI